MKVKITAAAALAAALAFSQTPAVVVSPVPQLQFFDNNGKPLSGGQVCTYAAGTTTPLTTYTSSTGTVANPNPVILDASGRANIWIAAPAIKYVLRAKGSPQNCSNGTTLYTVDGVQDQALKLRTDITGPNGLAMLTYTPPPTATVPTPGGGPIPMNQRAAQTINVQDFDAPPFATCGVQTHDDTPALKAAENYAEKNGGGTVMFPRGGQCWFNTLGVTGAVITILGSNVTFDGNGSTMNSTVAGIFGVFGVTARGWQDPTRMKYSFVHAGIGDPTFTVCAGCGVNFHVGDVIYTQSGNVILGTPFNCEGNVVNGVNGDVLNLRYPIEHQFTYSAAPDGVSIVTADTRFNLVFRNFRTARGFTGIFMGAQQCIHCSFLDLDVDVTGNGAFLVDGMSRDLLFDHDNVTVTNPNQQHSPLFQYSSGMADTVIRHSNFYCYNAGGVGAAADMILNPSEGSSNSVFEDGTLSGNCRGVGAGTFFGFTLKDSQISVNTPGSAEIIAAGAGADVSRNIRITGNTMFFADTANKSNVIFSGNGAEVYGNFIQSDAITGAGTLYATGYCTGCIIANNTIVTNGYGIVVGGIVSPSGHSFTLVGNAITCRVSNYPGIQILDDGQQTVSEVIQGNSANGCIIGLQVANPAHEIGSFTPNAFTGSATPYSPASLGGQLPITNGTVTNLSQIQTCTPGLTGWTPPFIGSLTIGCGGSPRVYVTGGNGLQGTFGFGSPANPGQYGFGYDDAAQVGSITYAGQNLMFFSPALVRMLSPAQINGGLTIGTASFTFNGKTCTISGTSISCI